MAVIPLDRTRYRRMWDVNVNGVLNGVPGPGGTTVILPPEINIGRVEQRVEL